MNEENKIECVRQRILKTLAEELPESVVAQLERVVEENKAQAEDGLYYIEIMEGSGNEIKAVLDRPEGHWSEMLTGEREPLNAYPGWYFRTYEDQVYEDFREVLPTTRQEAAPPS